MDVSHEHIMKGEGPQQPEMANENQEMEQRPAMIYWWIDGVADKCANLCVYIWWLVDLELGPGDPARALDPQNKT